MNTTDYRSFSILEAVQSQAVIRFLETIETVGRENSERRLTRIMQELGAKADCLSVIMAFNHTTNTITSVDQDI